MLQCMSGTWAYHGCELLGTVLSLWVGSGVVRIHMDDQMDSKTLLGAYTCTDVPGQFRWQPGVLTQVRAPIVPLLL